MRVLKSQVFVNIATALFKSNMMQHLFCFWNLDLKAIFRVHVSIVFSGLSCNIFFSCCLLCVCFSFC